MLCWCCSESCHAPVLVQCCVGVVLNPAMLLSWCNAVLCRCWYSTKFHRNEIAFTLVLLSVVLMKVERQWRWLQ
ncbi:hypothetical protein EOD39_13158 [Acipenser ruthenus]|uniref:Uncharacterized protein n=1 Tax=Acipenser ruthenus TaxID=7906 RepID=A0A662YQP9_ACIRT|nr:hypothetical protein EOD39_13158 [Acipenser ruthenus]